MIFKLYDYDVWGNNKDGWEVNNIFPALKGTNLFDARPVYIRLHHKKTTDKDIIKALKSAGWLNNNCRYSSFEIEGDLKHTLYVSLNNKKYWNRPICELRRLSNEEVKAILDDLDEK